MRSPLRLTLPLMRHCPDGSVVALANFGPRAGDAATGLTLATGFAANHTREMARMQIKGPLYCSASAVLAAIDGLALTLTGQREYFHLKGHGGHSGDPSAKDR
jgi:hypothetical protein